MTRTRDIISIAQDSREQQGLARDFDGLDCTVETGVTLPTFDYCLLIDGEIDGGFAVERKSLPDFVSSVTTTDGWRRELNKIERYKEQSGGANPVYVVECRMMDILPSRRCSCWYERASKRCPQCQGHGLPFCDCVQDRPNLNCEMCGGKGNVGYDYSRRKVTPQFVYRRVCEMIVYQDASILFADSRIAAAAMIEGLLRRRYDYMKLKSKAKKGDCNDNEDKHV